MGDVKVYDGKFSKPTPTFLYQREGTIQVSKLRNIYAPTVDLLAGVLAVS